jgi:hypothetical protein
VNVLDANTIRVAYVLYKSKMLQCRYGSPRGETDGLTAVPLRCIGLGSLVTEDSADKKRTGTLRKQ